MSDGNIRLLREISHKLSQLIVLTRLSNSSIIEDIKQEIRSDKVSKAILEMADGSLSAEKLKNKVISSTKVSDMTVKRRIAYLLEKGALVANRKGKQIFYENTGLYD